MFKNWFKPRPPAPAETAAPTALTPYLVEHRPSYWATVEGYQVAMPSVNVYRVPAGDALLLLLDLREKAAKGDRWARRDIEEIQRVLNLVSLHIERPF